VNITRIRFGFVVVISSCSSIFVTLVPGYARAAAAEMAAKVRRVRALVRREERRQETDDPRQEATAAR
jgi:hypothetical protein